MSIKSKSEKLFDLFNALFMLFVIVVMIYPIINQIAVSMSSNSSVISGKVSIWPVGFTLKAYQDILLDANFKNAMINTIFFTIVCTLIQVTLTALFAYPLSKTRLKGLSLIHI